MFQHAGPFIVAHVLFAIVLVRNKVSKSRDFDEQQQRDAAKGASRTAEGSPPPSSSSSSQQHPQANHSTSTRLNPLETKVTNASEEERKNPYAVTKNSSHQIHLSFQKDQSSKKQPDKTKSKNEKKKGKQKQKHK